MQQVIVYKARPETVFKILGLLRQEGLNPIALDNPDGTQEYATAFTCVVRIAVPEEESQEAKAILDQWEKASEKRVEKLSGQFSKRWAGILLGLGMVFAAVVFWDMWVASETIMVIGLLILLIVPMVYIYNRWKRRRERSLHDRRTEDSRAVDQ